MLSEKRYLQYRDWKARCLSLLFFLLRVFPINRKKLVFSAYEGDGGFCCNPRYLAEELHRRNSEYQIVWLTHVKTGDFPDYIRVVRDDFWNTAFHLATAVVWIDNYRKPYGTRKRKGQFYLQTWHASLGFKAVGLYRGDAFPEIARRVSEWDSSLIDLVLSNSDYCDRIYPKKLLYQGATLRSGSPRVDCLIRNRAALSIRLRETLKLPKEAKLLLYAPTFRGGSQKGKKEVVTKPPTLDFARVRETLREALGGEWYILLRLHPQLSAKLPKMPMAEESDFLLDVSQIPDINEILAGCDFLITDYSSCAFDACYAYIPVLLYADDVTEYQEARGQFMWERDELPFEIAENNDALCCNILKFDAAEYEKRVSKFLQRQGIVEDGNASARAADVIEEYMRCEK